MKPKLLTPLLAVAVLSAAQPAFAQTAAENPNASHLPTEKGSIMAGANLADAYLGFGGGSVSSFSISVNPRIGYAVSDNFVPGISFSAGLGLAGNIRAYGVGAGLFGRYFFGKLRDKNGDFNRLRPFAELGAAFATSHYRYSDALGRPERQTLRGISIQALAGADYFLNRNVALEAGINYGAFYASDIGWDAGSTVRLNLGLQLFFPRGKLRQPIN